MSGPQDFGQLKTLDWKLLQALADHFQEAWQAGQSVDLQHFLPAPDNPLRPLTLRELVLIDLEMRWRHGQVVSLEYYLEKFPELAASRPFWAQLLAQEYRIRHRFGDKPDLVTYRKRFPDQFDGMCRLLENDEPARSTPSATRTPAPGPVEAGGVDPDHFLPVGGGYKLLQRIGSGSFGEVWRAEAPGGFPAAVKLIFRPLDHEEAQKELRALETIRGLRHPCLVQTQAFWPLKDRLYIVMELADASLRGTLEACRAAGQHGIPPDELLRYFRDAAEGLDYLHRERVLHRDIKPENILLVQGHAKLADFGLARFHGSAVQSTATGAGTPLYMAPEVFRGKIDLNSDQYSLAMTYAELRLDRRLLVGANLMELMLEHLQQTPDLAPLPEAEQRVILRALHKDPQQRYPSCTEWVRDLQAALEPPRPPAPPTQKMPAVSAGDEAAPTPARQRPFWPFVLVAVAAGFFLAGLALYVFKTPPSTPATTAITPPSNPATRPGRTETPPAQDTGSAGPTTRPDRATPPVKTVTERPAGSFRLEVPETPVRLHRGESKTVPLTVHRTNVRFPIEISTSWFPFPNGPVIPQKPDPLKPPEVGDGATDTQTVELHLKADTSAPMDGVERFLIITAAGDGRPQSKSLKVAVLFLPAKGAAGSEPTQDPKQKWFYRKITWSQPGGQPLEFVLVPQEKPDDSPTFYIMVEKVSVGQFKQFADQPVFKVGTGWNAKDPPNCPALGMTWNEADRFAREWMGGKLPSTKQWDKAAGFKEWDEKYKEEYDKHQDVGPFQGKWDAAKPLDIAVGGKKKALGEAKADWCTTSGCRDMAGDGKEWTSTPRLGNERYKELRGQSFEADAPLLFTNLKQDIVSIKLPTVRDPELGFRVAMEP